MKNYYQILEISTNASQENIKEQYRFLAQAWHPDKFANSSQKTKAEEKIKEINEAFAIISNPTKRAKYDREYLNSSSNKQSTRTGTNRQRSSQGTDFDQQQKERSDKEKNYAEQARQQTEQERRQREQAEKERQYAKQAQQRAEKERQQKEQAEKERKYTEQLRQQVEFERQQNIIQIDQRISLLTNEINELKKKEPRVSKWFLPILVLIISGSCFLQFTLLENNLSLLRIEVIAWVVAIAMEFVLLIKYTKHYQENYKPTLDKIEHHKQQISLLMYERQKILKTR